VKVRALPTPPPPAKTRTRVQSRAGLQWRRAPDHSRGRRS
jgi:hypothetical protein